MFLFIVSFHKKFLTTEFYNSYPNKVLIIILLYNLQLNIYANI